MNNTYLMGGVRTAIGKYGGSLKSVPSYKLSAAVLEETLVRTGITADKVSEVIMGEVRQSTEASNIARCSALLAGYGENVPAYTVNRLCGSGMQAIMSADMEIKCNISDCVVCGGTENESRVPMFIRNGRWGDGPMVMVDPNIEAGSTAQPFSIYGKDLSMSRTAENVAKKYGISRKMQDEFAFRSQMKAKEAIENGWFKDEIIPIEVKEKKKSFLFSEDEFVKKNTSLEKLSLLKSFTGEDGTVTAGNCCGMNDGAAAVTVMSEEFVKRENLTPEFSLVKIVRTAIDPRYMGIGPVSAIKKVLDEAGMKIEDIDIIELNEAFAAQALACINLLELDINKVNVGGGGIALGHPLGCTGARIIVTLMHHLKRTEKRYGLASLCIGGGQGMAAIIERL